MDEGSDEDSDEGLDEDLDEGLDEEVAALLTKLNVGTNRPDYKNAAIAFLIPMESSKNYSAN
ncbi:hypothetical protein K443DRAFT_3928 [Laccaria amethystina LaAM-08-1]|uniref:Uncharacterized protein n=1 Tax=Laccaria amethystina LaAM-08-1 TaxID=1095629 RepID=A0A0C9YAZ7_9AGAR|nr:hypothetical protein K443DRAFT_3928 [Laccaria amethystina LaAM-08-1]